MPTFLVISKKCAKSVRRAGVCDRDLRERRARVGWLERRAHMLSIGAGTGLEPILGWKIYARLESFLLCRFKA